MNVLHPAGLAVEPLDPTTFTGTGTLVRMVGVCQSPNINVLRVSFERRARTDWHAHSGPQLLLVIEGTCRFQRAGGPVQQVAAGGVVAIEPNEVHWHGATPDAPMTHVAVNVDAETSWLEKVTDEEYSGEGS